MDSPRDQKQSDHGALYITLVDYAVRGISRDIVASSFRSSNVWRFKKILKKMMKEMRNWKKKLIRRAIKCRSFKSSLYN